MPIDLKTEVVHCIWPAIPSLAGAHALALQYQFEASQHLPPEKLYKSAFAQLQCVLGEAFSNIPHWRAALQQIGFQPGIAIGVEEFSRLPLLGRADVQHLGDDLLNGSREKIRGDIYLGSTSGSTGTPVTFYQTELTRHFWRAITLREHLWHERDFSGKLAAIRSNVEDARAPDWGPATQAVVNTGPCGLLNIRASIDRQLDWLKAEDPDYLITHPSNLMALAKAALNRGLKLPGLRQLRTFGEVLTTETRDLCQRAWGVGIADVYSSEEAGYIALQCPQGAYHVQAENLYVEILDEQGRPCLPGTIGRVVITTLHNFAMPLIRYDIGDFAMAGGNCACGRTLPVLNRILGRQRNMLKLPDGSQHWPSFPEDRWVGIAPIRQIQVVQTALDTVVLRVVAPRNLTPGESARLIDTFRDALGFPHRIDVEQVPSIPGSGNFKYEDFLCEIA